MSKVNFMVLITFDTLSNYWNQIMKQQEECIYYNTGGRRLPLIVHQNMQQQTHSTWYSYAADVALGNKP